MGARTRTVSVVGVCLPVLVVAILMSAAGPSGLTGMLAAPAEWSMVNGPWLMGTDRPAGHQPSTINHQPWSLPPKPYAPAELVVLMVELEEPPLAEVYAGFKRQASGGRRPASGEEGEKGRRGEGESRQPSGPPLSGSPSPLLPFSPSSPDASRFDSAAMQAALPYLERIEQAQEALIEQLTRPPLEAKVLSTAQRVYNGIAVQVPYGRRDALCRLPGVKAVHVLTPRFPAMDTVGPWVGAPRRWNTGRTGEGIDVAIVDTGVDYTHADLGGSGNPAHFTNNDPTRIGDVPGFPGPKVVGGFDFAGDDFNAISPVAQQQVPVRDIDPMDPRSHGTPLASIIAGFGVTAAGATFAGPYNATTPVASLAIGPGIAPLARLWAYKVFGRVGATRADLVISALERVVDPNGDGNMADHLDVAIVPLIGTPSDAGPAPDTDAVNRMAQVGVVPVTPVGNFGDTLYHGAGLAERALTVATSSDNGLGLQRIQITQPARNPSSIAAGAALFGPPLTTRLAGDVVATAPADGSTPLTNATSVNGRIAFMTRGIVPVAQVRNAQAAGAIAAIIAGDTPEPVPGMLDDSTGTAIGIPVFQIGATDAEFFRMTLAQGTRVSIAIEPRDTLPRPELGDTVAPSSARGGHFGTFLKPDIAAPGQQIFAARGGGGTGGALHSGTSAAAAVIAGAAALILQEHPDWTVEMVKAALMNATSDLFLNATGTPPLYGPARVGAGRLNLAEAGSVIITSMREGLGGALSFGNNAVLGTLNLAEQLRVVNRGNTPFAATVRYVPATDIPGVAFSFPDTVNVPAGGVGAFQVLMTANAAQMKHTRDATLPATVAGVPPHFLSEESGFLLFTPLTGGPPLRVPVYAAARPASSMRASQNSVSPASESASFNLSMTGTGVQTGTSFPLDEISRVSAFEHQETSPDNPASSGPANSADIRFLGIRSTFPAVNSIANTTLVFAYAAYGPWRTPNDLIVNIFIDADRDGADDFWVLNISTTNPQGGRSDLFLSAVQTLWTGATSTQAPLNAFSASQLNTVPYHTNVMFIPVRASAIGLTETNTSFNYRVTTQIGRVEVDRSQSHFYDAARPGVHFGATLIFFDRPGDLIPVTFNRTNFRAAGSSGILLLHHHNRPEESAQVVLVAP